MNNEKWNKYIKTEEINKTLDGMDSNIRFNDLDNLSNIIDLKNKSVLDIGCEHGNALKYLKNKFNIIPYGLTLEDVDVNFIKKGDMHELPYDDNSMDVVIIMHTLEHSISPYIVLNEIRRVLKDDGFLFILMPEEGDIWTSVHQHYSTLTFRQIFNLLYKLGFEPIESFRKEYMINLKEFKRDIFIISKKTNETHDDLIKNYEIPLPVFGKTLNYKGIELTPVFFYLMPDNKLGNHFLCRDDKK